MNKNPSTKPRLSEMKEPLDLAPALDAQQRLTHDIYMSPPGSDPLPRVVADSNCPFNQLLPTTGLTSALGARSGPAAMPCFQPQPWHVHNQASTSHPADTRGKSARTGSSQQPYSPEAFNFSQAIGSSWPRELQLLDKLMQDTAEDGAADGPTGVLMTETNDASVSIDLTLAHPSAELETDDNNSGAEPGVDETADDECGPWGGML